MGHTALRYAAAPDVPGALARLAERMKSAGRPRGSKPAELLTHGERVGALQSAPRPFQPSPCLATLRPIARLDWPFVPYSVRAAVLGQLLLVQRSHDQPAQPDRLIAMLHSSLCKLPKRVAELLRAPLGDYHRTREGRIVRGNQHPLVGLDHERAIAAFQVVPLQHGLRQRRRRGSASPLELDVHLHVEPSPCPYAYC